MDEGRLCECGSSSVLKQINNMNVAFLSDLHSLDVTDGILCEQVNI